MFCVCMFCYCLGLHAQGNNTSDSLRIRPAKTSFTHVHCLPEIESPLLAALEHFPELQDVDIRFKYKNIKTTMVSRPTFFSLFSKRRTFVICIDNRVRKNQGISFQEIPAVAKVGLLGHELCHIVDYQTMSSLKIVGMGFKYAFSSNHYAVESHVDKLTIQKGLGHELYEWTDFVLNGSSATEKYKTFKKINYLALAEILLEIEKLETPAQ